MSITLNPPFLSIAQNCGKFVAKRGAVLDFFINHGLQAWAACVWLQTLQNSMWRVRTQGNACGDMIAFKEGQGYGLGHRQTTLLLYFFSCLLNGAPINLMEWLFCLDNYQNLYCGLFPQQVLAIFFFFFIFFKKKMKNFTKLWVGPITDSLIACIWIYRLVKKYESEIIYWHSRDPKMFTYKISLQSSHGDNNFSYLC